MTLFHQVQSMTYFYGQEAGDCILHGADVPFKVSNVNTLNN